MISVAAGIDQARTVKDRLTERLAGHAAVNGIGLGRGAGGWIVKVNLVHAAPDLDLPPSIDGVAIHVDIVGSIRAR